MPVPELISWLKRPEAYSHAAGNIVVVQTHISYVLLAGEFAYKIKKPVDFGFVDYSSLERRRVLCGDEVRLNRRLCNGVYLGVVPITRDRQGTARVAGSGDVIEYAVKMRRVPDAKMMPAMLASGRISTKLLYDLAARIARFHKDTSTSERIGAFGSPAAIRENWEENFEQAARFVHRTIAETQLRSTRTYVETYLQRNASLFEQRVHDGRVRDCHGDLRADAVVFDDGSVCVMDCIEFNERLRYGDVASDVAFLAMDLEFRGNRREADEFVSFYLESSAADETFTTVFKFYRAYRSFVRGKVDSLLAHDDEVPEAQRAQAAERAVRYFALATAEAETESPKRLVVMSGLSGTGKSFIGRAVAARLGATLLSTDAVRHEMGAGATPGPYGEGSYDEGQRERVYDEMLRRAHYHLDRGRSALLDGTFLTREQRDAARDLAASASVPLLIVQVIADPDMVWERLRTRTTGSLSDARWDTYLAQRKRFEPLDDVAPHQLVTLDATQPLDLIVDEVCERSQ